MNDCHLMNIDPVDYGMGEKIFKDALRAFHEKRGSTGATNEVELPLEKYADIYGLDLEEHHKFLLTLQLDEKKRVSKNWKVLRLDVARALDCLMTFNIEKGPGDNGECSFCPAVEFCKVSGSTIYIRFTLDFVNYVSEFSVKDYWADAVFHKVRKGAR